MDFLQFWVDVFDNAFGNFGGDYFSNNFDHFFTIFKAKIVDLKDRRKRFADCNVQGTLAARKINMDRILQLF